MDTNDRKSAFLPSKECWNIKQNNKQYVFQEGNCSHPALWHHSMVFSGSVTSCGRQHIQWKGSGQNNHRQISSRLSEPGWTSRFFQNSIRAWIMTGSAGTQSYLDHCGARVIEFEGRRERCGMEYGEPLSLWGQRTTERIVSWIQPLCTDLLHACRDTSASAQQRPF